MTDTTVDITEVVLKNNIFQFGKRTLKHKQGTAISTGFTIPLHCRIFVADLELKMMQKI